MQYFYCSGCNQTIGIHIMDSREDVQYCPLCGEQDCRLVDEYDSQAVSDIMEDEEIDDLGMRLS